MATVRTTITLTLQQDAWIAAQVEAGSYTNDSEATRALTSRRPQPPRTARPLAPAAQPRALPVPP